MNVTPYDVMMLFQCPAIEEVRDPERLPALLAEVDAAIKRLHRLSQGDQNGYHEALFMPGGDDDHAPVDPDWDMYFLAAMMVSLRPLLAIVPLKPEQPPKP